MNAGDIVSYAEKRYAIRILLHIGDNPGCSMNDLAASIRGGIHTIRERVMEAEPYIVGQYPFSVVFPSGHKPVKDISQFIELPEFIEIGESSHMAGVVGENLVEHRVAILEASRMYRNHQHPWLESVQVRADDAVSLGYT